MTIRKLIIVTLLLQSHLGVCQPDCIYSCNDNDGWCGTYLKVYSDSSFILTMGCERMQSIQVGKLVTFGDTLILQKCDLTFENFIDSIIFIQGKPINDTIDIFYFDNCGQPSFAEGDFLTYADSSERWLRESEYDCRYSYTPGLRNFSRTMQLHEKTGRFLSRTDFYYYSHKSYLIDSERTLTLVLKGFYDWTKVKKAISIPPNTKQIDVHYSFPQEIISILNEYSVELSHSGKTKTWSCDNKFFTVE